MKPATPTAIPPIHRRALIAAAAAGALLLGACATSPSMPRSSSTELPPIVFVHGNGDTAALWLTTIWRFESNGWPRERLHAIDMPYPLARDDDGKPQDGRSSTTEAMQFLAAQVEQVRKATGAAQVVLYGNSRGGNAIRNYIANGGGATTVSHAILGGTPNHGVWADKARLPNSEFNGAGPFLSALNNTPAWGGNEVPPGVKWMTIRSDNNDKFAQPDGVWIGAKGTPTNVGFDGPELKGAQNVVIAGIDHRETSFSPKAFEQAYRFITGKAPAALAIAPEAKVELNGKVSGLGLNNGPGNFVNNLPLAGATVEVFATDAASGERLGPAVHRNTVGRRWPVGSVRRRREGRVRVRHRDAGLRHHAHLPRAIRALVEHRQHARRAAGGSRQGGRLGADLHAPARLLRRAARQVQLRRHQPAAGRAGGGGGRLAIPHQAGRHAGAAGGGRVQRRTHRRPQLAGGGEPGGVDRAAPVASARAP